MPLYEYRCPENGQEIEVLHAMSQTIQSWGELCSAAGLPLGDTPPTSPVSRKISSVGLSFPKGNSQLKNMGFTKLVKRESGVYENVTATGNEKRYMRADDPSSFPDLKKKIRD
jgi:predicted nucleic acid-binding Zn ribbon protein